MRRKKKIKKVKNKFLNFDALKSTTISVSPKLEKTTNEKPKYNYACCSAGFLLWLESGGKQEPICKEHADKNKEVKERLKRITDFQKEMEDQMKINPELLNLTITI